jgi:cation:H+ antiporter
MLHLLILAAGFILLIFGADKLVDASSSLAKRYNIPNIVIGLTIVAFGTSAPELVVNSLAAYHDNSEMVLGNVIGSNIFNVLVILGITAIIFPNKC